MSSPEPRSEFRPPDEVLASVQAEAAMRRRTRDRRQRRLARAGAAAVVLVVAVAVVAVAATRTGDRDGRRTAGGPATTVDSTALSTTTLVRAPLPEGAGEGWAPLAAAPLAGRSDAVTAWTGRDLLVWGGNGAFSDACRVSEGGEPICGEPARPDGARYDPAADRWRPLPAAPLATDPGSRFTYAGVWTGRELLVWGGPGPQAAAYDPVADVWRTMDPGPLSAMATATATWTGRDVVVVGRLGRPGLSEPDGARLAAAAFDPATGRWRDLGRSDAVTAPTGAAWSGSRVVVVGLARDARAVAVAVDPVAGTWHDVPAPPIDEVDGEPVTMPGGVAVVGREAPSGPVVVVVYDDATGHWRDPIRVGGDGYLASVAWTGRELVVWAAGDRFADPEDAGTWTWVAVDPVDRSVRPVPAAPLRPRYGASVAWIGTELLVWGGAISTGFTSEPLADGARYIPGPGR